MLTSSISQEVTVPVQDNQREKDVIELFGLLPGKGRIGVDAWDEFGNPYELKTTSKGGVSTARDLGPRHIDKWSERYWIISRGRNLKSGFQHERIFFLAPVHMTGWYEKLMTGFRADMSLSARIIEAAGSAISTDERMRAERLLYDGMLLNDPNIPWGYVEANGIEIVTNHAETLRELVKQFPILSRRAA